MQSPRRMQALKVCYMWIRTFPCWEAVSISCHGCCRLKQLLRLNSAAHDRRGTAGKHPMEIFSLVISDLTDVLYIINLYHQFISVSYRHKMTFQLRAYIAR